MRCVPDDQAKHSEWGRDLQSRSGWLLTLSRMVGLGPCGFWSWSHILLVEQQAATLRHEPEVSDDQKGKVRRRDTKRDCEILSLKPFKEYSDV